MTESTECPWCEGAGEVEDHNDYTNTIRCSLCKSTGQRKKDLPDYPAKETTT